MTVNRRSDFRQFWKFCWDLSDVISGGNWLFGWDYVFSGGTLHPSANYGFCNSLLWHECYIQTEIVFQWSFLKPTQWASLYWFLPLLFCYHDWFTFQKFCASIDGKFLVPNESHDNSWRDSEKWWSEVLHKERFICIPMSRFISLNFLSTSLALNISWFWKFCHYLGASDFGQSPVFQK